MEAFTYCWTDHGRNMLYVGYHKHKNINKPYQDNYVCSQSWMKSERKKRPQDFTRQILAEGTADDCHALEVTILKAADAMHSKRFYNQTNGSKDFVHKHCSEEQRKKLREAHKNPSEETRKKISDAMKGKKNPWYGKHASQEVKNKWSIVRKGICPWNKGKSCSLETRKKISESKKGSRLSEEHKRKLSEFNGEKSSWYGKHHSEESKKKISATRTGKPLSESHKEKIRIGNKGKAVSVETKNKMSVAAKRRCKRHE